MKIAIIGYSGSGKSTLAQAISQHYNIPLLHLDTLQFEPGWQDRPQEIVAKDLQDFLEKNKSWVIDGNYSFAHYERIMAEADQIIFLNFPRWKSLLRGWRRYRTYKGKTRESMATGCPEKFDWEFIRWILWDGRKKSAKERYARVCQTYPAKVTVLSSQKEIDHFLNYKTS